MGLKKAENQVKILLAETIMALCRNTLNNHAEVSVEGLLGITLDNDEIFLVSINQTINNPDVPSKKRTFEEDRAEIECKKSRTDCSESENENDSEKKARRRKRRRRRRSSDGGSEESSDSDDSDSVKTEPVGEGGARGDFSETPRSTNKTNFSRVRIKRESNESEDQDLVIVKEELGDHHGNVASTSEFPFMAQSFHNLQQLASTSLNNFQPPNSSMNDSIASHSQQSMELSSPQPGPSINQPGPSANYQSGFVSTNQTTVPINKQELELTNQIMGHKSLSGDLLLSANEYRGHIGIVGAEVANEASGHISKWEFVSANSNNNGDFMNDANVRKGQTGDVFKEETSIAKRTSSLLCLLPKLNGTCSKITYSHSFATRNPNPEQSPSTSSTPNVILSDALPEICISRTSPSTSEAAEILLAKVDPKDLECPLCKRQFQRWWNLKRHMLTHTGERNFNCSICHKKFSLKHHVKLHTEGVHGFTIM